MKSERIGNVLLNLDHWPGHDTSSDGDFELELLSMLQNGKTSKEILEADHRYPILYHLSRERENILSWFPFSKDQRVLEIGAGCGAVTGVLIRTCGHVVSADESLTRSRINAIRHQDAENLEIIVGSVQDLPEIPQYDVITLIGVLEYSSLFFHSEHPFEEALAHYKSMLKPGGQLLIAIGNRFGMKYFAGAREDQHRIVNEGLYGYPHKGPRTFTRKELSLLLSRTGFDQQSFFGVWPDHNFCDVLFSDAGSAIASHAFGPCPNYGEFQWESFDPSIVMRQAAKGGLGVEMASSFFVCAGESSKSLPAYIKYATKRNDRFAVCTKVYPGHKVEKMAFSSDGVQHILKCRERLLHPGQKAMIADMTLQEDGTIAVPFYDGQSLIKAFFNADEATRRKLADDYIAFLSVYSTGSIQWGGTEEFTAVFGDAVGEDECLNPAPIDINFGNIILSHDRQTVIDPEWTFDFPVPVKYIVWRTCFLYQETTGEDITRYFGDYASSAEEQKSWKSMEYRFGEYAFGPASPANINKQYMVSAVPVKNFADQIDLLAKQKAELHAGIDALKKENQVAWQQFSEREKWLEDLRKENAQLSDALKSVQEQLKQQQDAYDSIYKELDDLKQTWVWRLYQKTKGKQ
ncbi:MAG: methyltransferase [Clostridia bacterium]|nr:methyltransferase [Clostridia bacterium]